MKNKKPIIFIAILFFAFIGLFVIMIGVSSKLESFKKEVTNAKTFDEMKAISKSYSDEIINDDKFQSLFLSKLDALEMTVSEINEASTLFQFGNEYLNLVIVPDLSNRLIKKPKQSDRDLELIETIYNAFSEFVKNKNVQNIYYKSKDRLTIDVSDKDAAGGQFQKIANSLIIDLSEASPPFRKTLDSKKDGFMQTITELYELGKKNIRGADYWDYFNGKLKYNEKASKFSERYRNVVIFLSDGYLELDGGPYYTSENFIKLTDSKYDSWEILILEVDERNQGEYKVLKDKWFAWLNNMHMKVDNQNFFQERLEATIKTKNVIESFILKGLKKSSGNSNVSSVTTTSNCAENLESSLKVALNLLDGSHSFEEIKSIKPILNDAIVLKNEGCSSNQMQVKEDLELKVDNLLKSSETLASQIEDADIMLRVEFYSDIKSMVNDL